MQKVNFEDSILIGRVQRGDNAALDQLIRKYSARAYQYAYRLTRSSEEAGDIVADAFVRVFKALKNFHGASAFTTWLYRIETNCFLDMRKKQRATTISLDSSMQTTDGELAFQIEDDAPSPLMHAEQRERWSAIEAAVDDLPDYYRAMITMYHADMMSYEEIARTLELPLGTVKSRLNRARLALRDYLSPNVIFEKHLQTA